MFIWGVLIWGIFTIVVVFALGLSIVSNPVVKKENIESSSSQSSQSKDLPISYSTSSKSVTSELQSEFKFKKSTVKFQESYTDLVNPYCNLEDYLTQNPIEINHYFYGENRDYSTDILGYVSADISLNLSKYAEANNAQENFNTLTKLFNGEITLENSPKSGSYTNYL
jgi:hypothetical protein